jgi:formylglycine-generating enzyme required for sulfatase activity
MKRIILITIAIFSIALLSVTSKKEKKENFKKDYVYIPSGTFEFEEKDVSVAAFYMLTTEVTNKQYREFILDLKIQRKRADYLIAVPDTMQWKSKNTYNEPYVEYYFQHPAYDNYPVVNVTKAGAELYSIWLTKKMRSKYPKLNFNDFRLPSKEEWVYAAKGGLKHSPYPWGGPQTTNSEGDVLANYLIVGDRNITKDEKGKLQITKKNYQYNHVRNEGVDILAPSKSYWYNNYGLYNMAGNAAELVARDTVAMGGSWRSPGFDIQVTSEVSAIEAKPTIGFRVVSSFVGR